MGFMSLLLLEFWFVRPDVVIIPGSINEPFKCSDPQVVYNQFMAGFIDHRCQRISFFEAKHSGVAPVETFPGVFDWPAKLLAGFCGVYAGGFTLAATDQILFLTDLVKPSFFWSCIQPLPLRLW